MQHRGHKSVVIADCRRADFCHSPECGCGGSSGKGPASERVYAAVLNRFVVTVISDVFNLQSVVVREFVLDLQAPLFISRVLQMRCDGGKVRWREIRVSRAD
jgi:hypothetical protein